MKPVLTFYIFATLLPAMILTGNKASAQQQYKLRQSTNMTGMKSENTIYVKGMRKRTEGGGMMGMGANLVTIEQCDLKRTIKINDKKKLYFIEPIAKETDEVIDEDVKPVAVKNKPAAAPTQAKTLKGGVITTWYNIRDTGERKKVSGFTARHIWTTQKIKPSADACMMKDSMIIKTDGWYIDLPEFNCPVSYRSANTTTSGRQAQPECKDQYITRRSGKGKLGFPLSQTTTIIMGNSESKNSEFVTSMETLEFSTAKLDSMLFEIPPGYNPAATADELQDKFDINEMIKKSGNTGNADITGKPKPGEQKKSGVIRIGVFEPKGEESLQFSALQQQLVSTLTNGNTDAVAITSKEDAVKYNCDLLLNTSFIRFKQGSKVGGLLKAIKNSDPSAAASYNIEALLILTNLSDGATRLEQKVNGKYEGKPDEAARKAVEEGGRMLLKALK